MVVGVVVCVLNGEVSLTQWWPIDFILEWLQLRHENVSLFSLLEKCPHFSRCCVPYSKELGGT